MPERLTWDNVGEKQYETGVDQGVLYPVSSTGKYDKGIAWNGLTAVNESPSGAEPTNLYADNVKYISIYSAEEFGCTIEAYTYPSEFEACDGSAEISDGVVVGQQARQPFGLSYRTLIGDDVKGQNAGYKLHLIYGATASPSEKNFQTINDSPEAITFSWECKTTPVPVEGLKPSATVTIDSRKLSAKALKAIEDALYGTKEKAAWLPLPNELKAIIDEAEAQG